MHDHSAPVAPDGRADTALDMREQTFLWGRTRREAAAVRKTWQDPVRPKGPPRQPIHIPSGQVPAPAGVHQQRRLCGPGTTAAVMGRVVEAQLLVVPDRS